MAGLKNVVDLSGEWVCKLDENEEGIQQKWYERTIEGDIVLLPGTLNENGIGKKYIPEEGFTKENVRCLRAEYQYIGAAWYQKTIYLDEEIWIGDLQLYFERVMFQSQVWVNGIYFGSNDSLSTPHIYKGVKEKVSSKTLVITICINNRDLHKIGTYSSAYTDETQTIWNGIVGKLYIVQKNNWEMKKYNISADAIGHKGIFEIEIETECKLDHYCIAIRHKEEVLQKIEGRIAEIENGYRIKVKKPLNERIIFWNEFHPNCYEIEVTLMDDKQEMRVTDRKITGFCQIEANAQRILVNGTEIFLRGNIDCCFYPLTGYPPMDKMMWYKVMRITKDYGMNHIRFHSWCPPEAAFEVADELGIYLQVEGPMWLDNWMEIEVGKKHEHYDYLPKEAARIIKKYSYHASFCIFSNGNELNGDFILLENMIVSCRRLNPHILYTLTTNWDRPLNEEDDIFISQSVDDVGIRGQYYLDEMVNTASLNFDQGAANRKVPVIAHEVGQYVVYPNVNEISKYQGNIKPLNFETIKQDLERKQLDKYVSKFVYCSGMLAKNLYKAEFEAALNTENMSGIQLLSLQDFPGQSTATVGLLDVFFESKGIVSAEEFKSFCNSTVLLLQLDKKFFSNQEKVHAQFNIANYYEKRLTDVQVNFFVMDQKGEKIYEEIINIECVDVGLTKVGAVLEQLEFSTLKGRQKLSIKASIGESVCNEWNIWVYERLEENSVSSFGVWDETIIEKLNASKRIILTPKPNQVRKGEALKYFPVFWSPVHFLSKDPCGMIINNKHIFFKKYYKCEDYADYEWKIFMEHAIAVNLDELSDLEPLTMPVPNFYNNHKSSALFEVCVGSGKLLICGLDFMEHADSYQIQYLKKALLEYVNSEDFNPAYQCRKEDFINLFTEDKADEGIYEDIALGKGAFSDSEKSAAYTAGKGNDGNLTSRWQASDRKKGHYWQVDLGTIHSIRRIEIDFNEKGRYLYVIQVSNDGVSWDVVVNRTGMIEEMECSFDDFEAQARFVRIVYNDMSNGMTAGHKSFRVYA